MSSDALWTACAEGRSLDVDRLLLLPDVDPAAGDQHAVRAACRHGRAAVVWRLLRDERVDPSACRDYALRAARAFGHRDVVRLLLADPRVDGRRRDVVDRSVECEEDVAVPQPLRRRRAARG